MTLNRRTLAMLAQAQAVYGGELEITGHAITQGSYSNSVQASFGTHSGGGAVDLSVLQRGTYTVLWEEIEPLLSDQELPLSVRYWEGAVVARGTAAGRPVTGRGYVEMTGYAAAPPAR